jgi:hypothetical protein
LNLVSKKMLNHVKKELDSSRLKEITLSFTENNISD